MLIWLTYRAGLRIAETLSITAASFDRDGALHIDRLKGSKDTVTKLDADTVAQIGAYIAERGLQDEDLLFQIEKSTVNYFFEKYCKVAGIDRAKSNPHALRHGFGHLLINSGATLPQIQRAMGHASIASTGVYVAANNQEANGATMRAFEKAKGGNQ